jgi:hypothetical protein
MTIANPLEYVFLGYNELSKWHTLPLGSEGGGTIGLHYYCRYLLKGYSPKHAKITMLQYLKELYKKFKKYSH